ncbi:hypothetical protein FBZ98_10792 [Rhizobium sp. ERR 922]|nr:hypothetical protein FBZ98_10792 [Rhizobium sp. ERR 922]TWB91591.1 hypothetical protein FBZ97_10792 [Rhizobium sp. ERR 942]
MMRSPSERHSRWIDPFNDAIVMRSSSDPKPAEPSGNPRRWSNDLCPRQHDTIVVCNLNFDAPPVYRK